MVECHSEADLHFIANAGATLKRNRKRGVAMSQERRESGILENVQLKPKVAETEDEERN